MSEWQAPLPEAPAPAVTTTSSSSTTPATAPDPPQTDLSALYDAPPPTVSAPEAQVLAVPLEYELPYIPPQPVQHEPQASHTEYFAAPEAPAVLYYDSFSPAGTSITTTTIATNADALGGGTSGTFDSREFGRAVDVARPQTTGGTFRGDDLLITSDERPEELVSDAALNRTALFGDGNTMRSGDDTDGRRFQAFGGFGGVASTTTTATTTTRGGTGIDGMPSSPEHDVESSYVTVVSDASSSSPESSYSGTSHPMRRPSVMEIFPSLAAAAAAAPTTTTTSPTPTTTTTTNFNNDNESDVERQHASGISLPSNSGSESGSESDVHRSTFARMGRTEKRLRRMSVLDSAWVSRSSAGFGGFGGASNDSDNDDTSPTQQHAGGMSDVEGATVPRRKRAGSGLAFSSNVPLSRATHRRNRARGGDDDEAFLTDAASDINFNDDELDLDGAGTDDEADDNGASYYASLVSQASPQLESFIDLERGPDAKELPRTDSQRLSVGHPQLRRSHRRTKSHRRAAKKKKSAVASESTPLIKDKEPIKEERTPFIHAKVSIL
jgi:hypothetical protein